MSKLQQKNIFVLLGVPDGVLDVTMKKKINNMTNQLVRDFLDEPVELELEELEELAAIRWVSTPAVFAKTDPSLTRARRRRR